MIATFWELFVFFLMSIAIGILSGHLLLLITDDTEKQCNQAYKQGYNQALYESVKKTIPFATATYPCTLSGTFTTTGNPWSLNEITFYNNSTNFTS